MHNNAVVLDPSAVTQCSLLVRTAVIMLTTAANILSYLRLDSYITADVGRCCIIAVGLAENYDEIIHILL